MYIDYFEIHVQRFGAAVFKADMANSNPRKQNALAGKALK